MKPSFWRGFWEGMNLFYWLAWLLYLLGDGVSRVMALHRQLGRLYPLYNWLMSKSVAVQDRFGLSGPWEPKTRP